MKRWNAADMFGIGHNLFAKIYKKQRCARHNHPIHFLARELDDWLSSGVHSMINGTYTPQYLKRRYFPDEVIDQLHLSDRILQHILLKQLKPTIQHVTRSNCVHTHGSSWCENRDTTYSRSTSKSIKPHPRNTKCPRAG